MKWQDITTEQLETTDYTSLEFKAFKAGFCAANFYIRERVDTLIVQTTIKKEYIIYLNDKNETTEKKNKRERIKRK